MWLEALKNETQVITMFVFVRTGNVSFIDANKIELRPQSTWSMNPWKFRVDDLQRNSWRPSCIVLMASGVSCDATGMWQCASKGNHLTSRLLEFKKSSNNQVAVEVRTTTTLWLFAATFGKDARGLISGALFPVSKCAQIMLWFQMVSRETVCVGQLLSRVSGNNVTMKVLWRWRLGRLCNIDCWKFVRSYGNRWLKCHWTSHREIDVSMGAFSGT